MADTAYKLKGDASFSRNIRKAGVLADGTQLYETIGSNYGAGSYILSSEMTERDAERAENGDLDHLLEKVDLSEAEEARANAAFYEGYGTFVPEHEAERVVLETYGHEVVPKEQVLQLRAAGADSAKADLEAAKEAGADERPNLTAPRVPTPQEVGEGDLPVPEGEEHLPVEKVVGLEQPPGLPLGDPKAADLGAEKLIDAKPKRRSRPGSSSSSTEEKSE